MTYKNAIDQGCKLADTAYQRGYVSRKCNVDMQTVHVAKGNRNGQMYVLLPCWESSQYCIRQYLAKA